MTRAMTSELPQPILRNSDPETLAAEILKALNYRVGKDATVATQHDWLTASIKVVRDRIIDRWIESTKEAYDRKDKRVYYLSLEFLIGRLMRDAFSNLGLMDDMREALRSLGVDLDVIAALEPDAALGNGGLGRLAACFMECMATVDVPAHGYGIRYVNGMFRQEIPDGWQVELPETWLDHGNPWEFERRERSFEVGFGGTVESVTDKAGRLERHVWKPQRARPGRRLRHAGRRLARQARQHAAALVARMPIDPILLDAFNAGDHIGALRESNKAEALSRVLYPADSSQAGQELRLRQEYFFSTASLQDILQRHLSQYRRPELAARQGGDPSQRHASGHRGRRTDAAPDGRARHRFRRRLGHHQGHLRLHQPHAAARGAGKLAGAAVRAAAAAPHADHLRDQRRDPARGARRRPSSPTSRSAASR